LITPSCPSFIERRACAPAIEPSPPTQPQHQHVGAERAVVGNLEILPDFLAHRQLQGADRPAEHLRRTHPLAPRLELPAPAPAPGVPVVGRAGAYAGGVPPGDPHPAAGGGRGSQGVFRDCRRRLVQPRRAGAVAASGVTVRSRGRMPAVQ
ncbi:hypothetical protein UF36_09060, partial [Vibrio parahaemolyticus]